MSEIDYSYEVRLLKPEYFDFSKTDFGSLASSKDFIGFYVKVGFEFTEEGKEALRKEVPQCRQAEICTQYFPVYLGRDNLYCSNGWICTLDYGGKQIGADGSYHSEILYLSMSEETKEVLKEALLEAVGGEDKLWSVIARLEREQRKSSDLER